MFNSHFPKSSRKIAEINLSTQIENRSIRSNKTKTGKSKPSVLFRRKVFEYRHGLICDYCLKATEIISFSPKPPKYCGSKCRARRTADYSKQKYWSSKHDGI